MSKNELVSCFQDTLRMCENGKLKQLTEQAKESTKVYKENFKSKCSEFGYQARLEDVMEHVIVQEGTTFATAKEYVGKGKIGVLHFANPHNPGGGVAKGAMAQEECLCRSSNLYPCLLTDEAEKEYYTYNKENTDYFFSDRIIYSDNVTVFKTDDTVPYLMPENEWFNVSVITCAAPYIAKRKYTNKAALKDLFKKRIENIFEVALENDIKILILGAFGCGAFKNPPDVVAKAFNEVIAENYAKIQTCFDKIVFAIKNFSENYKYFDKVITGCAGILAVCPEYELPEIKLPNGNIIPKAVTCYTEMGCYTTIDEIKKLVAKGNYMSQYIKEDDINLEHQAEFLKWQHNNKYFGKQFSILGDSISTLKGYNPRGYKVFYAGENCGKSGVSKMQHTWWGKVIDFFGGELLVNNSWSGSRVTKLPNSNELFPSGCSDERTNGLHINNVKPNVIIVYLGTNDWAFGARLDDETRLLCFDDMEYFEDAYSEMLRKLKQNYPNAEIWCCTLNSTYMSSNPNFVFPETYNGNYIGHYNEVIRTAVKRYDCKLIDLYDNKIPYDSIDGSHPTSDGMNTLATLMIRSMSDEQGRSFLNCEENEHDYIVIDEFAGNPKYVCRKCGIEKVLIDSEPIAGGRTENLFDLSSDNNIVNGESERKYNTTENLIGKEIDGRYKLLKLIGRGGISEVYLAINIRLNKTWAIKVCRKTDSFALTAVLSEATMMKQLNHEGLPMIVDIIDEEQYLFIVMEYVEGVTIDRIIREYGPQPEENVVGWAKQVCSILSYLHTLNPPHIHRDIKPANLMLTPAGNVKLIDFSIMRTYDPNKSFDEVALGTMGYASPEGFHGQTDPRSDIYSLGVTMHELLTGVDPKQPPYELKPICQVNSSLSKGLEYIINKCIQLNPDDRYQNCSELLQDLNQHQSLPKPKGIFGRLFKK